MFLKLVNAQGEERVADEDKLVAAGVEAAMKPFADLLEKLAGPAAEEIGLTIKDHVRVFRLKRQLRLFKRVKDMLEEAGMEPKRVPFTLLQPIVENASIEDKDALQDRWAAMLANAAITRDVHPSFPEILKQLDERDALYLDATYEYEVGKKQLDTDRNIRAVERKRLYEELEDNLTLKFARGIGLSTVDVDEARKKINVLSSDGPGENAIRLGLMRPIKGHGDKLTGFGMAFVKACRPPAFHDPSELNDG